MRTIETTGTVPGVPDGSMISSDPPDVPRGGPMVVTLADRPAEAGHPLLDLPVIRCGVWPEGLSLRREDIYGDDGR